MQLCKYGVCLCLKAAYKFTYKPGQDVYLRFVEIEDSRCAFIVGQSRRAPYVQMGLAERGLAMYTSVILRRRRRFPNVDWNCAEYYSKVLARDTLMDWVPMSGSSVAWCI